MKKEKFLFELIDNYLYTASVGCMAMENYLLEDRTGDYTRCANNLDACLDFYDQLYEQLDDNIYSEQEVDAILEHLIQLLKQSTMKTIQVELKESITGKLPDAETFLRDKLLHDKSGKAQDVSASVLINFMKCLRMEEAAYALDRND